MRNLLLIILAALLCVVLTPAPPVHAEYVYEAFRTCTYSSTEDCIGFSMVTETCAITYTNGTTATTTRTYPDPTMCLWCHIFDDPCLDDFGWV